MVLELTDQDIGRKIDFHVESMGRLDTLTQVFKNMTFSSERAPLSEKVHAVQLLVPRGCSLQKDNSLMLKIQNIHST